MFQNYALVLKSSNRAQILFSRYFANSLGRKIGDYEEFDGILNIEKLKQLRIKKEFMEVPIHHQTSSELVKTVQRAAELQIKNPNLWSRCSTAIIDLVPSFKSKDLATIVNAYAKVGYRDQKLFKILARRIALNLEDARPVDLTIFLRSYSSLGIAHPALYELLCDELPDRMPLLSSRGISLVLESLAASNKQCPEVLKAALIQIESRGVSFDPFELINCARSILTLRKNAVLYSLANYNNTLEYAENSCPASLVQHAGELFADCMMRRVANFDPGQVIIMCGLLADLGQSHQESVLRAVEHVIATRALDLSPHDLPGCLQTLSKFNPEQVSLHALRRVAHAVSRHAHVLSPESVALAVEYIHRSGHSDDTLTNIAGTLLPQRLQEVSFAERTALLVGIANRMQSGIGSGAGLLVRSVVASLCRSLDEETAHLFENDGLEGPTFDPVPTGQLVKALEASIRIFPSLAKNILLSMVFTEDILEQATTDDMKNSHRSLITSALRHKKGVKSKWESMSHAEQFATLQILDQAFNSDVNTFIRRLLPSSDRTVTTLASGDAASPPANHLLFSGYHRPSLSPMLSATPYQEVSASAQTALRELLKYQRSLKREAKQRQATNDVAGDGPQPGRLWVPVEQTNVSKIDDEDDYLSEEVREKLRAEETRKIIQEASRMERQKEREKKLHQQVFLVQDYVSPPTFPVRTVSPPVSQPMPEDAQVLQSTIQLPSPGKAIKSLNEADLLGDISVDPRPEELTAFNLEVSHQNVNSNTDKNEEVEDDENDLLAALWEYLHSSSSKHKTPISALELLLAVAPASAPTTVVSAFKKFDENIPAGKYPLESLMESDLVDNKERFLNLLPGLLGLIAQSKQLFEENFGEKKMEELFLDGLETFLNNTHIDTATIVDANSSFKLQADALGAVIRAVQMWNDKNLMSDVSPALWDRLEALEVEGLNNSLKRGVIARSLQHIASEKSSLNLDEDSKNEDVTTWVNMKQEMDEKLPSIFFNASTRRAVAWEHQLAVNGSTVADIHNAHAIKNTTQARRSLNRPSGRDVARLVQLYACRASSKEEDIPQEMLILLASRLGEFQDKEFVFAVNLLRKHKLTDAEGKEFVTRAISRQKLTISSFTAVQKLKKDCELLGIDMEEGDEIWLDTKMAGQRVLGGFLTSVEGGDENVRSPAAFPTKSNATRDTPGFAA